MAKPEIKCVIFDSDGTLVDSEHLGHYCMELKLKKCGVYIPAQKMKEDYRGWKLDALLEDIKYKNPGLTYSETFIPEYREDLQQMFEESLKPIPMIDDALSRISIPICVASSGPMFKIKTAMRVTGLAKYFNENLFSAYDLGVWKPEPDLFLHTAEKMGFLPENCAVVEDSKVGVQAAIAANMRVVHYNPESISIEDIKPTIEIASMGNLIDSLYEIGLNPQR